MFENISETIIKGSNTIFLNVPEKDYFLSYDTINNGAAEEITKNYFNMKQKDGIAEVKDIDADSYTHRVKITVEVNQSRDSKLEPFKTPDMLNIKRNQ